MERSIGTFGMVWNGLKEYINADSEIFKVMNRKRTAFQNVALQLFTQ